MSVTTTVRQKLQLLAARLNDRGAKALATELLEVQHREVEDLLATIERSSDARKRRALLAQLAEKLAAHMLIEQEIFYPACKEGTREGERVLASYEEHGVAGYELARLLVTDPREETFDAKLAVFKELVLHHVQEEERALFPRAERQLGRERLASLGALMRARYDKALGQGYTATMKVVQQGALRDAPAGARPAARASGGVRAAAKAPPRKTTRAKKKRA